MRVVVTGGSGKGGRWVVRALREHGHAVTNVDLRHDGSPHGQCVIADLTDLGQAQDVLAGADAVVHFAAIPAPELRAEGETFRINALSTYNVFAAAVAHRLRRVVWASSETVLGLPFDRPPDFAPIDESITARPESSYALSKLVGETLAGQFARRSGIGFVGLRISNIMEPEDYAAFPSYWDDPTVRKWNLWGYVDARDVAAIQSRLAEMVHEIFVDELNRAGYPLVAEPSHETLRVTVAIVDLFITAPDTMSPERTSTFTADSGRMTLVLELRDSVTGEVLARAADTRTGRRSGPLTVTSRTTNTADARRAIRIWASGLRQALAEMYAPGA